MAIAGGSTMPMGDLKTAVNNSYLMGWNVTVPFGWDFGSFPLGLRFDLAMDNLRAAGNFLDSGSNPILGRNVAIYSGSGGLKLNIPLFRTASRFYLIGGAGAHRITGYATSASGTDSAQTVQNAKTDIGWYGGAGLNFRSSSRANQHRLTRAPSRDPRDGALFIGSVSVFFVILSEAPALEERKRRREGSNVPCE